MRWNKRNFGILKVCREKEHGRKKRVTRMEKLQKTITELNDKLVDCLEKCLIYGHIRRFAD